MLLSVVLHLHSRTFDGKKNITIVGVSFVELEKLQQMILILPIVELHFKCGGYNTRVLTSIKISSIVSC